VGITNITMSPPAPAVLSFGGDVTINFQYTSSVTGGIRIFARPMTGGSLSSGYSASGSILHPAGSGNLTVSFRINSGAQTVDQIRFQILNGDQSILLEEFFVVVSYTYR
jgi:hypothetical protein